jgi:RNA polymerase primary sigma factor
MNTTLTNSLESSRVRVERRQAEVTPLCAQRRSASALETRASTRDVEPGSNDIPLETRPGASRDDQVGIYYLYLREIGPIPLLSAEEEMELARRIQRGDETARDQMITANLKLVVKIAHDFEGCGLPLLDLIEEGNLGLMKAIERFDPDRGNRLASYAAFWIKQYMRRSVANHSRTIRLPVHVHEKLWRLNRTASQLREELGRMPSDEELAEELSMSLARVNRLQQAALGTVSLDAELGDHDSAQIGTVIPDERAVSPDEHLDDEQWRNALERSLKGLDARELAVVQHRFGLNGYDDHTLEEVGAKLKLTRERIRQIQNHALKKIRANLARQGARYVAA